MKLEPGMDAPDFDLEDHEGKRWTLADVKGRKTIVYFYPADDTPGCTVQACDFRDARGDLQEAGYFVLGVSPQGKSSHERFVAKYGLNFPLLIDSDLDMARAYGAIKEEPEEWEGIRLHVKRSTFVIDEEGRIAEARYGVRAKGHVDELLDVLT